MTNPFTAKVAEKKKAKLKAFGSKKPSTNGKVEGKPKLQSFTGKKVDRVTTVGKKQSEDWIIGRLEIQLEEHNNLYWTATVTLDGESRVFHNKSSTWMTDRTEDDDWPGSVVMKEAIPDLARTLQGYLHEELKRQGRLKVEEEPKPKKGRGKK